MRIAWYSNMPTAPTGYGEQSALIIRRLKAAGHDVHIIQQFGGPAKGMGISEWEGCPVYPQGAEQYSLDVLDANVKRIDPDYVMTLFDVWPLEAAGVLKGVPVISWTPVDHYPAPPKVVAWAKAHPTIAMSEFGQRALAQAGAESAYIPHAIDGSIFTGEPGPLPAHLNVPDDAFLVMMNFANNGVFPDRKARGENLQALSMLMHQHPDVYAYIHTDLLNPGGVPLPAWFKVMDIPMDRVRYPDPADYRFGTTSATALAHLYQRANVFLGASAGEGFGIPVAEAMMSGTPAIVTDFSAQPEIVGDTGWRVPFQFQANWHQGSFLATPMVGGILEALQEAYDQSPEEAEVRSGAARARAVERYDMDTVWATKWVSLLADMEANAPRFRAERAGLTAAQTPVLGPNGQPLNRAQRRAQKRSQRRG